MIDGETIVQDDEGRPDFPALRRAIARWPERILFYAFDLLHLDGRDLRQELLADRRAELVELLKQHVTEQSRIQISEVIEGTGADAFAACCQHGPEGIVSKRRDSPYRSGSSRFWVKAKCWEESDLVIIGTDQDTKTGTTRLLLASDNDGLTYQGAAVFNLPAKERDALRRHLDEMSVSKPPIPGLRKPKARWVRPELKVRVRHLKGASGLRHASVRGLVV